MCVPELVALVLSCCLLSVALLLFSTQTFFLLNLIIFIIVGLRVAARGFLSAEKLIRSSFPSLSFPKLSHLGKKHGTCSSAGHNHENMYYMLVRGHAPLLRLDDGICLSQERALADHLASLV
jgi:hypothetical protein